MDKTSQIAPAATPAYHCRACSKWEGVRWLSRCPECLTEGQIAAGRAPKTLGAWGSGAGKPVRLIEALDADYERIRTGTREFDRVLGGGVVTGSTILLAGDPGIGKSTLLLQTLLLLSMAEITEDDMPGDPLKCLYISGEETEAQIKHRGIRIEKSGGNKIWLISESNMDRIEEHVINIDPDICVFDSINTLFKPGTDGSAGTITQIKGVTAQIVGISRARGIGSFIVAHVTKDGAVSGPKTLEHLVDAVLEFHKEGAFDLRSITPSKNRFGDTSEMALFKMSGEGLRSVENPSELLLEGHAKDRSGIAVGQACRQGGGSGGRPLHLEIQTLLGLPLGQGSPKRHVTGMDGSRVGQAIAVLERRLGLPLYRDVFVNIPGGLSDRHTSDPALDLPLCLAIASSLCGRPLPEGFCAFGEVGLGAEIRNPGYLETRIKAAGVMGFKTVMGPAMPKDFVSGLLKGEQPAAKDGSAGDGLDRYKEVRTLEDAIDALGLWPDDLPDGAVTGADDVAADASGSKPPVKRKRFSVVPP